MSWEVARGEGQRPTCSPRQVAPAPSCALLPVTPHLPIIYLRHLLGIKTIPRNARRWYWRVTLPGDGQSFALIYSIDNPLGVQPLSGVGAQVMGPDDSYLIHYSKNVADFWADRNSLALGAVFQAASPSRRLAALKQPLSEVGG